ncbi:50S ribosomal protein L20 [Eubacteriales bacterium OttesenSCG-928-K08]|nr:50S ribosomal protein L20 [Eubacteriales bacterium OttesenSCG-928-K08]
MARIKRAVTAQKKRRKVMKLAKGYYGAKSKQYRSASQQVMKSMSYAYVGRKQKKRDFRKLWISRINAGARINGTTYSRLMYGLKLAGIDINRKVLADLAVNDMPAFKELVDIAVAAQ